MRLGTRECTWKDRLAAQIDPESLSAWKVLSSDGDRLLGPWSVSWRCTVNGAGIHTCPGQTRGQRTQQVRGRDKRLPGPFLSFTGPSARITAAKGSGSSSYCPPCTARAGRIGRYIIVLRSASERSFRKSAGDTHFAARFTRSGRHIIVLRSARGSLGITFFSRHHA